MADAVVFDHLPIEILEEIFKNLDGKSLGKCRRVSKKWKDIIDDNDVLWREISMKEREKNSLIARRHCGSECSWYNIHKNLEKWVDFKSYEKNVKEFHKFMKKDRNHVLDFNYGVLPLKDGSVTVLYDLHLKQIPIQFQGQNCLKLYNNDIVTVLQLKDIILVQRSVDRPIYDTAATFEANEFLLTDDTLYFHKKRDIYKCNLRKEKLTADLITSSNFDIKTLHYSKNILYAFSDYIGGIKIFEPKKNPKTGVVEREQEIKSVDAFDIGSYISDVNPWSIVEIDIFMRYKKLKKERPIVTAVFYYGNFLLYATKAGEIMLYHLDHDQPEIIEKVAQLPAGKVAIKLDACERPTGPIIIAATTKALYTIEINFFPHEVNKITSARSELEVRLKQLEERVKQLEA